MEYIVLDLEWNSAYYKPQGRFINEIIQIGAVKLDENFKIIDKFQIYIKSRLVKKLSNRTINLTGITTEKMQTGVGFREAVSRYNIWAGDSAITMTWSDSDLYAIVENSRIFLDNSVQFYMRDYIDLQTYIQNELKLMGHNLPNQISLGNAAELLGISTDGFELHNALDDSYLCGLMLSKTYNKERFSKLIRNTTDPTFFERLFFRTYHISNINDARINKSSLVFYCPCCKKRLATKKKWKFKNNWFRTEGGCDKCNLVYRCMIAFKQTFDKLITRKRVLPMVTEGERENATL